VAIRGARAVLAAAAMVAAVGLAGCGGDDEDSDGGDSSAASFCDLANDVDSGVNALDDVDPSDTASVEAAFTKSIETLEQAEAAAPDEIKDDVAKTLEGFRAIFDVLESNDFDLVKASQDPAFAELAENEEFSAAADNVEAFVDEECGTTTTGG